MRLLFIVIVHEEGSGKAVIQFERPYSVSFVPPGAACENIHEKRIGHFRLLVFHVDLSCHRFKAVFYRSGSL